MTLSLLTLISAALIALGGILCCMGIDPRFFKKWRMREHKKFEETWKKETEDLDIFLDAACLTPKIAIEKMDSRIKELEHIGEKDD